MLAKLLTLTTFAAVAFGQLAPTFPQGYFYIKNNATGKVLDVFNLSREPGANIVLIDPKKTQFENQLWKYENGYLVNNRSQLVIEIPEFTDRLPAAPGTILKQAQKRILNDFNQVWLYDPRRRRIVPVYDPAVCISAANGTYATVERRQLEDEKQEWGFVAVP